MRTTTQLIGKSGKIEIIYMWSLYNLPSVQAVTIDIAEGNGLSFIPKGGGAMQAYCMKCRTKREMKETKSIIMKNGRPATQGICPVCGTKMFRIGKS